MTLTQRIAEYTALQINAVNSLRAGDVDAAIEFTRQFGKSVRAFLKARDAGAR